MYLPLSFCGGRSLSIRALSTMRKPRTPRTTSLRFLTRKRMTQRQGEVWLFDLGMAGKVRPALVVSVPYGDQDRALITIVPHTTSLRGSEYEIRVEVAFLKPGAFWRRASRLIPMSGAIRRLGALNARQVRRCLFQACCAGWARGTENTDHGGNPGTKAALFPRGRSQKSVLDRAVAPRKNKP